MSTPVSNTCGLDSVKAVVVVDTTTCLVAESGALECLGSSAHACSFKTESHEEEKESSWEDLEDDDAVLPEIKRVVDVWGETHRVHRTTDTGVLDWSVRVKDKSLDMQRFAFIGLSRRMNKGARNWAKPSKELRTQLRAGCKEFASFGNRVESLAIRCDEVTGLLLVLRLFSKWDHPEIAGLDDMIRNLIIPVVVEQRKEELWRLSQKYPRCLGSPRTYRRCKCSCCLDRREKRATVAHFRMVRRQESRQKRYQPTELRYGVAVAVVEELHEKDNEIERMTL